MDNKEELELYNKIGNQIKILRNAKGITLAKFMSDTGIHIGRIERGERFPTIGTLDKVCKYLEISLSNFFRRVEDNVQ